MTDATEMMTEEPAPPLEHLSAADTQVVADEAAATVREDNRVAVAEAKVAAKIAAASDAQLPYCTQQLQGVK